MDAKNLIRGCIAGDAHAWRVFVDGYGPWVLRCARRSVAGHRLYGHDEVVRLQQMAAPILRMRGQAVRVWAISMPDDEPSSR